MNRGRKAGLDALQAAVNELGYTAIASACACSYQAVQKWMKSGVPAEQVIPICIAARERGSEITPHALRPDLYPDPEWIPPSQAVA